VLWRTLLLQDIKISIVPIHKSRMIVGIKESNSNTSKKFVGFTIHGNCYGYTGTGHLCVHFITNRIYKNTSTCVHIERRSSFKNSSRSTTPPTSRILIRSFYNINQYFAQGFGLIGKFHDKIITNDAS